jgi:shikimate kinase
MEQSQISNLQSQIFLIGFMACGKSTVGPVLAAKLDRPFIDLDPLIEAKAGCTIAELIARAGEERFRQMETETLREAAQNSRAIIAPGGGAITRAENRQLMSQLGITVWLDAPFDLCWRRIEQDATVRPLAPNEESARARYEQRLPLYKEASVRVAISEWQLPDEISEAIAERLIAVRDTPLL